MQTLPKRITRAELEKLVQNGCNDCGERESHVHGPLYIHIPHPPCPQLHAWHIFYRDGSLIFECASCHVAILECPIT